MVWRRELGVLAVNWTDVLDGEIVNAAWALAGMVARPRTGRKVAASLDTAAWADTERLIRDALSEIAADPELPELPEDEVAELEAAVRRPEVQGALQALLAVRLTDAPETDAARAREAVRLALATGPGAEPTDAQRDRRKRAAAQVAQEELERDLEDVRRGLIDGFQVPAAPEPARAWDAGPVSEYFDEKISALVAAVEGRVGFAGLAQVRAEAYNARIVALLGAIERQVAALADPGRRTEAEAAFLDRYRRQAHLRHGFLTPPDFDRRRRVPVADIYVPTGIREEDGAERMRELPDTGWDLNVWDLADRAGRTVLLGDPGGGKTTATNVLTDHFAADGSARVAFLVTLREYAAKTPIEWSVAEHVEHNLKTLYQSPAPDGLVERLLLTGRAVVIFDGLDELLDTSRRRDVSDRVEQFCSAYPLTPVLVTSRVVGYDQARLDDTQFSCYRLGGFGDAEVTEYAGKWFGTQEGLSPEEAAAKARAFIAESAHATDLRANPLLLSLMCILYRSAGSLPGDRAGIYAKCAELLLRKWDEQRDLYRKLGSDHLVEPTLRYLAWWLFTGEDSKAVASERELTDETAEFLYERGYETEYAARAAAREFVEFCRGRMWVFSDAGTTADGEQLYGFTHRTFLEYFAAWHLAVTSETPEELARLLLSRITAFGGWEIVGELAVKLKSDAADQGADRVYGAMLDEAQANPSALAFIARCTASARPSPGTVRRLARAVLDYVFQRDGLSRYHRELVANLLNAIFADGNDCRPVLLDEMSSRVASIVASGDRTARAAALQLVVELARDGCRGNEWAREQEARYAAEITAESVADDRLRATAFFRGVITLEQVLEMPDGFSTLAQEFDLRFSPDDLAGYFTRLCLSPDIDSSAELTIIGRYVTQHPEPPWVRSAYGTSGPRVTEIPAVREPDEFSGLGAAVAFAVAWECAGESGEPRPDLTDVLWIPEDFYYLFREWTVWDIDFVSS
jgi:hypothetical protein